MLGPHRRLQTISIAGGGTPETSQNSQGRLWGSAAGEAQWPIQMTGRERESAPLPSDAAGQLVDVA